MSERRPLIVTRHKGLVEWLRRGGHVPEDVEVVPHATIEQVADRDVIGILPIAFAVHCRSYAEVPMDIPRELRGVELTADQVEQYRTGNLTRYDIKVAGGKS